jgi:steroid 5-alpha reductase family enzyme
LWLFHYIYRSFVFSSLMPSRNNMPLSVVLFAVIFNGFNSYLQGGYLYMFSPGAAKYGLSWLTTPQFLIGAVLFFSGFVIHVRSDHILRTLRNPGETGYRVPRGWLFRWVSAPNYFGEIVEWIGWAVLTWSLPGLVFALWTIFNLLPRGVAHHRWYRETFEGYPEERRAVIPGIL